MQSPHLIFDPARSVLHGHPRMTSDSYDCVVVGGGIVGTACAAKLARDGMHVAIVDCLGAGLGATAAGMGHIVVMDDSPAQFLLTQYSQKLWLALSAQLPQSAEFLQCGTLWVAADEEEMAEVERKHSLYSHHLRTHVRAVLNASAPPRALNPNLNLIWPVPFSCNQMQWCTHPSLPNI